jgi:hypothetical protein
MCQKFGAGDFVMMVYSKQSYITVSGYIIHEMAVCTNVEAELLMLVVSEKLETKQICSK